MLLGKLRREFLRPIKKRLARTFATRSELEHLLSTLNQQLVQADRRIDAIGQRLVQAEQNVSATGLNVTQLAGDVSAASLNVTQLAEALHRLDTSEQFSRQALHNIATSLFGGFETVSKGESSVGVVIPSCDRPEALRRALTSVARQSRKPEVVVVVNDGREEIGGILNEFTDRLTISALTTNRPYSGSSAARNLALDALDTTLVAFLDDDNVMWPLWIERAAAFLEADPKIDILYGVQLRDEEFSNTEKNWFLVPFDLEKLKRGNFIDINQIMHRSSAVRFDPNLKRLVDWDYVLRLTGSESSNIVPVNAISSLYSSSAFDRISVPHWPPDLGLNIARREGAGVTHLPHGSRVCSCCGFAGEFRPGPRRRPVASCPRCGSLERHRFLQLVGPLLRNFWVPETRFPACATMIEVAPSPATASFRGLFGVVTTVDPYPDADGRSVDVAASLTDLPMPSDYADVLVALHVLEHIREDRQAMSEMARVLAPNGVAILQVPMSGSSTTDEEVLDTPEERAARYGQADHVRLYGNDFYQRLGRSGLTSVALSPRETMLPESIVKYGLLPDEPLVFAVRSDVLRATASLEVFASSLRKGRSVVTLDEVETVQALPPALQAT
jgi:hypothetical protein